MPDGTHSESHEIAFGPEAVSFTIERTGRRKTVSLSYGADGLRVLAPTEMADDAIVAVVRSKARWILAKKALLDERGGVHAQHEFVSGESFSYLGRRYRLSVVPEPSAVVTKVSLRGGYLIAPVLPDLAPDLRRLSVRSGLKRWYQDQARIRLPERTRIYAARLGVKTPKVLISSQEKRWASCDKSGALRFNWLLMMAPLGLVDYVVAHELCHLVEMNHSPEFWRQLRIIVPDYEHRERQLSEAGADMYL